MLVPPVQVRALALAWATTVTLLGCGAESPSDSNGGDGTIDTQVEEANRQLLHDYHVEVWEQGHFDRAASYLGPGFVLHSVPILPDGAQPGADFFTKWVGAFSDLKSHEDAILSGGDRASIQWTITATHSGDFFGIAPTHRKITISGMDVLRVDKGKFVEQWGGIADQMDDVVEQLTGD